ncbi:MAG: MotA/TolQ/ExbB proton channel family protein [Ruoffia tabacinasalis]|uniref:MotA/TolQ/ExbB proton channel family protein n=1 Tax=Ruoffia tabacinasalis TaxID=87458 RepID=A0ABS0LH06_9LACT|nr:MotA/TolQ/ExbB proton channel family protein [Ruoffia tabacinasalis]MBG9977374.1 MotA/TolQ/ExbB proton channel family protein [Ruoffia tabacinasalis]HJG47960.1 MotA/TolQ/ExbB proton channel family protein [Ruoffia tabacinasalis]
MQFFQPILDNFFKFDFLIVIIAIGAAFLYYRCLESCKQLFNILIPRGNVALGKKNQKSMNRHYKLYFDSDGEQEILQKRQKSNSLYVLFTNVCAIFPLMGLLGTVISLIPMVGELDTSLFFMALTSTFWGIIFAIIFKALNGYLQARVEENNELVQTYLLRKDAIVERHARQNYEDSYDEI